VNTARGPIVQDQALYRALTEAGSPAPPQHIEEEPAKIRDWKPTNPLLALPNFILTSHMAWYRRSLYRDQDDLGQEIVRVLSGRLRSTR